MRQNNPLFVDSTKLHGDRIATLVELTGILVYEGESVVALVTDHQGKMHRVRMDINAHGDFEAKTWLGHQKTVTCQFLIEKEGQEVFHSAAFQARAQYSIIKNWEPVLDEDPLDLTQPSNDQPKPVEPEPNTVRITTGIETVSHLLEKWGL